MTQPYFAPVGGRSGKLACTVCGRRGYPPSTPERSWQAACLRGHLPCPDCGKPLAVLKNGSQRKHGRCPAGGQMRLPQALIDRVHGRVQSSPADSESAQVTPEIRPT